MVVPSEMRDVFPGLCWDIWKKNSAFVREGQRTTVSSVR